MGAGVASGIKGGRKLKRSAKDCGYYEHQKLITGRNKLRRKLKREKKAAEWAARGGHKRRQNRKDGKAKK